MQKVISLTLNLEVIKYNCLEYAKLHRSAIDVLKRANGRDDYKKIADNLKLHPTTVSSLLKQAQKLGLANKLGRLYKKLPGVLRYMPKQSKNRETQQEKVSDLIPKLKVPKHKSPLKLSGFKIKPELLSDAEKMAEPYKLLYITENVLRDLIRKNIAVEKDWWECRVNKDIRKEVSIAIATYPYDGANRKDELEYTHLGQLNEIILNNWEKIKADLNERDRDSFKATVNKALPYRNSIAHSTNLTQKNVIVANIRFEDILKMIKLSF
jgi:DNA-binding Lrp family transcriptional regulator